MEFLKYSELKTNKKIYASHELRNEVPELQPDDILINCAYTDYGGTFDDRVACQYFLEKYAENCVSEQTSYFGQNLIAWGDRVTHFFDNVGMDFVQDYDFEEYYRIKEDQAEIESFGFFLDQIGTDYTFDKYETMQWLLDNRTGYYEAQSDGTIDFSWSELTDEMIDEGIIKGKEAEEDSII